MKKGFTLVEMLAVIVVLSIIMAISIRSISAIRQNQLNKLYEDKIHNIEAAAILYGQENPDIFNIGNKCKNSEFNEEKVPGISTYRTYDFCVVITGYTLASSNFLEADTDSSTNKAYIKNDLNGYNMLEYPVIIYRNNNRVGAYVSVVESIDPLNTNNKILVQQYTPQGGAYTSCNDGKHTYKVLVGEEYKCGKAKLATPAVVTVQNNTQVMACQISGTQMVYGHEEYCCPENTVYIDGYCVSQLNTVTPTCPNDINYKISDNKNLCLIQNTLVESVCADGYTKTTVEGRYLCVENGNSSVMIAPSCPSGKNLSDNQNYCDYGDLTLSRCSSGYTKMFINNQYQCVLNTNHNTKKTPTCPTGKELTFRQLYCKAK